MKKTSFAVLFLSLLIAGPLLAKHKYTYLGEKAYARSNHERAMEYFQKALDAGETRGEPHFFMGNILEAQRNFDASAEHLVQAVDRPLAHSYKKAALWKLVLYFQKVRNYDLALRYIARLNRMGVHHKRLNAIKAEAETYMTPSKRQARVHISEAQKLEQQINLEKESPSKSSPVWRQQRQTVLTIIDHYEKAAGLDNSFNNVLGKAAYYAEALEDLNKAHDLYLKLASGSRSPQIYYKLGVIDKKRARFSQAASYLSKAREYSKPTKKNRRFHYYLNINLAQVAYGQNDLAAARRAGYRALQKESRLPPSTHSKLARLVYCNALLPVSKLRDGSVVTEAVKVSKACHSAAWKQYPSEQGDERALSALLQAKTKHYRFLVSKKPLYVPVLNYRKAFVTETLPNWARGELREVAQYFYEDKHFDSLYLLLGKHFDTLGNDSNYMLYQGDSAYHTGKYSEAITAYKKITPRRYDQQKALLACMANLGQWNELKAEIRDYVSKNASNKAGLLSFIQTDSQFQAFRNQPGYESFTSSLAETSQPETSNSTN